MAGAKDTGHVRTNAMPGHANADSSSCSRHMSREQLRGKVGVCETPKREKEMPKREIERGVCDATKSRGPRADERKRRSREVCQGHGPRRLGTLASLAHHRMAPCIYPKRALHASAGAPRVQGKCRCEAGARPTRDAQPLTTDNSAVQPMPLTTSPGGASFRRRDIRDMAKQYGAWRYSESLTLQRSDASTHVAARCKRNSCQQRGDVDQCAGRSTCVAEPSLSHQKSCTDITRARISRDTQSCDAGGPASSLGLNFSQTYFSSHWRKSLVVAQPLPSLPHAQAAHTAPRSNSFDVCPCGRRMITTPLEAQT